MIDDHSQFNVYPNSAEDYLMVGTEDDGSISV